MAEITLDIVIRVQDMATDALNGINLAAIEIGKSLGTIGKPQLVVPQSGGGYAESGGINPPGFGEVLSVLDLLTSYGLAKGAADRQTSLHELDLGQVIDSRWPSILAPSLTASNLVTATALHTGAAKDEQDVIRILDAASNYSMLTGMAPDMIATEIVQAFARQDVETLKFFNPGFEFVPPPQFEMKDRREQNYAFASQFLSQTFDEARKGNILESELQLDFLEGQYEDSKLQPIRERLLSDPVDPIVFARENNPFSRAQAEWFVGDSERGAGGTKVDPAPRPISPEDSDLENWLRFKTVTDEATESTGRLSNATVGWQGINSQLSADLDGTLEALGLQRNEVGLLHAVWGETSDALGEADEALEDVASQSQDVSRQTDAASSSFANLQQTDMGGFSAALGESLGEADVHVGALADTTGDLEGKFVDLGEGDATQSAAEAIENLHDTSAPQLDEMAGLAGSLQNKLRGIPANVSSKVNVDVRVTGDVDMAKQLGIPLGMWKAISSELATGGPLTDLSLVGEEGPELIIDGIVVPARETRKLMSLGLLPKRRYALGGPLGGGGVVSTPPAPEDFDPLNLEQRRQLRSGRAVSVESRSRSTSASPARAGSGAGRAPEAASLSASIQQIVQASLATVLPQAAGSVATASLSAANAQISREMNRSIEASNDRLLLRVDRLILETRRMKTYFCDAVRLVTD